MKRATTVSHKAEKYTAQWKLVKDYCRTMRENDYRLYGCSTVVLICFTCPAITVVTVILQALDRVRGRTLGLLGWCPDVPSLIPGE